MIKSRELSHRTWIMGSDDDQPIIQEIYAGFDARDNLVISIDNIDYEDHRYDCSTWVVVNSDDAHAMARRKREKYHRLPGYIAESMDEWTEMVNADFRQVQACFKEITECLLDEGCRFRVGRTAGPHGRIIC